MPYITMSLITNSPEYAKTGTTLITFEFGTVQFSIFVDENDSEGSPNTRIKQIADALKEAFDDATLSVDGYTNIMCRRGPETEFIVDKVWQHNIDYRIENQKN